MILNSSTNAWKWTKLEELFIHVRWSSLLDTKVSSHWQTKMMCWELNQVCDMKIDTFGESTIYTASSQTAPSCASQCHSDVTFGQLNHSSSLVSSSASWPPLNLSNTCMSRCTPIAHYNLFAKKTNREQNHFFTKQNIVCKNRANVLLYTVRCSPSIFARTYSPLGISFFRWKTPLLPHCKPCEQCTAKNLFAKHGENLLYIIRCTSLFHLFVLVSKLFANNV